MWTLRCFCSFSKHPAVWHMTAAQLFAAFNILKRSYFLNSNVFVAGFSDIPCEPVTGVSSLDSFFFLDKECNSENLQSHLSFYPSWQSCSHPDPCLLSLHAPLTGRSDLHCNAAHCCPPLHLGKGKERKDDALEMCSKWNENSTTQFSWAIGSHRSINNHAHFPFCFPLSPCN